MRSGLPPPKPNGSRWGDDGSPGDATLVGMRRAGVVLLVCLTLAASGAAAAPSSRQSVRELARERALDAYTAMQRYFYRAADGSYAGTYPSPARAQAWPFSQALWATLELASIPGADPDARADLRSRLRALAAYSHPEARRPAEYASVFGGPGDVYYDDNLWIALALVEASRVLPGTNALATARELFTLVGDGWDVDRRRSLPRRRLLDANRPKPRPQHRHDGERGAARAAARRGARLAVEPRLGPERLRLDEGLPRGAGRARRRPHRPSRRRRPAHVELQPGRDDRRRRPPLPRHRQAALPHRRGEDGERRPAQDRRSARLGRAAGLPGDLLPRPARAERRAPTRPHRAAIETFADEAWAQARDPATGLFSFGGREPTLLDQAAMVQVYAELARDD